VGGSFEELRGRDAEIALLRARLAEAREGRGGAIVLSGEAGIGKSALLDGLTREAERGGVRVFKGRAWEFADAPVYFPLRAGFRALGVSPAGGSEADAFSLWEDTLEALAREAAKTPLLWAIEDVHAADARTLDLLTFLAQPIRALPVLLVVTLRSGDPRASGPVLKRLVRLTREGARLELGRLGDQDVAAVTAGIAGRALPAGSIGAWVARTGGNPLFVVECARAVRAGRSVESALPETVIEVVVERVHGLPEATRVFLELGAVVGREFSAATVGRVAGRLPAVVIDDLLPALRSGLLEEPQPAQYRFAHALVRDAIEGAMPVTARREAHARTAAALAEEGDSPELLVERARHALEGLGPIAEVDAEALVKRAVAALEKDAAWDRAFALWRRWTGARSAKPDATTLLETSRLATAAGNQGEAERAAEAAAALAKSAGDVTRLARAALARGATTRPGTVDALHVRALEEALAHLDAVNEPKLRCLLRARLAGAMQPSVTPIVPVNLARAAIADARAANDDALLRQVLLLATPALNFFVDAAEMRAVAAELLSLSLAAGDAATALRAFVRQTAADVELGDLAAWDDGTDRMLALARMQGHPALTWRPLIAASARALAHGDFEESERLITEVEQAALLLDDPALQIMLQAHKSHRTFALDDEARIRAAQADLYPTALPMAGESAPTIRATFAVRLGDRAAAAAEIPAMTRFSRKVPAGSLLFVILGETVALAGTDEERRSALATLLPFRERHVYTAPIPQSYEGSFRRVIGLLHAALGELDEADLHLEAARAASAVHRLRPWMARLSLERGNTVLAAGRTSDARALFEEAEARGSELRMPRIVAAARAALGSRGTVAPLEPPTPPPQASITLMREGEIWRIAWGSHLARVKDSRGLHLLAKLASSPGERIHALVLAGDSDAPLPETDAGEAIDRKAAQSYRARLASLDGEIEGAESRADARRVAKLSRERELLTAEIARGVGLGGRLRKVGSATERARINVTRRLKDALLRIAEASPELGRHLESEVQTGTYCSYGRSR
jgi:hypothetical protein